MKLKQSDISKVRSVIQKQQNDRCEICNIDLRTVVSCLDHDHKSGKIRGVLCANCNGIEGKIFNLARRAKRKVTESVFLYLLIDYWHTYSKYPREEIHPTHKTK